MDRVGPSRGSCYASFVSQWVVGGIELITPEVKRQVEEASAANDSAVIGAMAAS
jgi:hypothetical protein